MKLNVALCLAVLAAEAALAAVVAPSVGADADDALYKLPPNFLIGAGISATQAEGAWKTAGKSETVMDRLLHTYKARYP